MGISRNLVDNTLYMEHIKDKLADMFEKHTRNYRKASLIKAATTI